MTDRSERAVFEDLGIDYCCGGNKPLDEACREKGLDPDVVAQTLQAAAQSQLPPDSDVSAMSMTRLVDHIEKTHHAYLKKELPGLLALARKVAEVHAGHAAHLQQMVTVLAGLVQELLNHLEKEEQILFPSLRELEATGRISHACFGTVRGPIQMMEYEHDSAGQALAEIRRLTDDCASPQWACNSYRAMLQGLMHLEADLHQHIHKENNILFPMAMEAERNAGSV